MSRNSCSDSKRFVGPGAAAALLALTLVSCGGGGGPSPARTSGSGHPLLVIGVDGATWDVIDPMIERGELPNFAALAERGVRGRLIAVDPLSSPVVWTTIATGRFPREHGILDFTFPYEEGTEKLLVRSSVRKVPAIWNVATNAGLSVGVVGYFATHPAEQVNGVVISDRAQQRVPGSVFPEEHQKRIRPLLDDLKKKRVANELRDRFVSWKYDRKALRNEEDPYHLATKVVTGRIDDRIVYDEFVRRAALDVLDDGHPLTMAYFRIVDHASHVGWLYYDDTDFETKPSEFNHDLLHDLVPESYRYMDEVIGELVAKAAGDTNIVIVSDHGFGSATGSYAIQRHQDEELTGNHRNDGLLLAVGPDIGRGTHDRMTIVDVAPTLMALAGLPISRELAGRVEEEIFSDDFRAELEPEYVRAYDFEWSSPDTGETVASREEQEALEALESLGYIGNTTASGTQADEGFDFWSIDFRLRRRALLGELTYLIYRGDERRARALIEEIRERDPRMGARLGKTLGRPIHAIEEKYGIPLFTALEPSTLFEPGEFRDWAEEDEPADDAPPEGS